MRIVAGLHVIILGAPGSGKGTQAARLAAEKGLRHLSTGDMLRDAVARKTEIGLRAAEYMREGRLGPDEIIFALMREALAASAGSGWILDGFPRTLAQAEELDGMLAERGERIDRVVNIDVDPELIVRRLSNRRVCPGCKAVYNLDTIKTKVPGRCDACGAEIVKRPDDEEETIRKRLRVYDEQTAPVIGYYRARGGLATVDGAGGIEEIFAEILRVLK
jgi:adenylate kinase